MTSVTYIRRMPKKFKQWTGDEVRALRHRLALAQRTFAEAVGVTRRTVIRWEQVGVSRRNTIALRALDRLDA